MGWRDRDYNRGREAMYSFFGDPASMLQMSLPVYTRPTLYIRLHFWLLLTFLFDVIGILNAKLPLYFIPADFAGILVLLLIHEFGHRVFARSVGGNHWEFVLWPLGGMVPPSAPRTPWATFVANIGGIAFTLPAGLLCLAALYALPHDRLAVGWILNPFTPLLVAAQPAGVHAALPLVFHMLAGGVMLSAGIVAINLFPAYWFDGGLIWQSILWPKLGLQRAIAATCMAGMVLSVPFFLLALRGTDFLGLVVWALIFAACFNRRREVLAAGPGVEEDEGGGYNYMDTPAAPTRRKKIRKGWFRSASRKAAKERAEQARIDRILAKVHDKGLHSLTWWEKRTLRRATERQRQRDLAERM